ncbi:hypothetical protein [Butyrivibrio proteoclasticus]|uniref:hypothetical protein n=1 Tax=Butyrivibrio proteoclasticus TaxID=43305 RepID=UPI00047C080D|nr:hypothetical protein [Butyrivibrio proteoclasticus]
MDIATKQKSVLMRQQLNGGNRVYVCQDKLRETLDREYHYLDSDLKLKRFAADELGFVSDCHLLYAVANLGVADTDAITMFNKALHRTAPELHIMDVNNSDNVRSRLHALMTSGFLFKITYEVDTFDADNKPRLTHMSLYTCAQDGIYHMNQVLGKRMVHQNWIQAKNPYEIVGLAASGYVASKMALADTFCEFKQGIFQTKAIGTCFIPAILKFKYENGEPVHVGVIDAYLNRYEIAQSKGDHEDRCIYKVNLIKQFLYSRDMKNTVGRAVVVVENNADLVEMADWIMRLDNLGDDLDRVYFTGEGVHKAGNETSDCFLRIKKAKNKQGYDLVPVKPDFL